MFLGIDIGTSGVKAAIIDNDGVVVSQSTASLSVSNPKPLWSEQNPSDWWSATNAAVVALDPKARSGVSAVGLSGQMHGATLLDSSDNPIRPAILWNDGRSMAECVELTESVDGQSSGKMSSITGNLAMPGFTAPKLLWVRRNERQAFDKLAKVLLPKDYVRLLMTGDYASDMSDSAGTLWLDVAKRDWSPEMLAACDLTEKQMPQLFEGSEATGELRDDVAASWGMKKVPVAAGGGDNAAGAVGSGVISAGEGFLSLGTSGVVFVADGKYRPNPAGAVHTFCHALPGLWHEMSVMLSAASAVDWVAQVTGFAAPGDLYAAAEARGEPTSTEIFLPYLSGERTPHNDPYAKGLFFGLTSTTDRTALAQAALEGVGFAFADGIDAIRDAGANIETLSVIGGGARSKYWGGVLAAILDRPLIYRREGAVGPAYGAARLARLALTGENVVDVCAPPPIESIIEPDKNLAAHLQQRRNVFKSLYAQTKQLHQET